MQKLNQIKTYVAFIHRRIKLFLYSSWDSVFVSNWEKLFEWENIYYKLDNWRLKGRISLILFSD